VADDPGAELKAVLWDFGGVILSSPFEAFARYERANGLPKDFIRTLNATNPDTNAWAKFERNEVPFDEFCDLFEAEASALGHTIAAREVMPLLAGEIRPEMVEALRRCSQRFKTACLTNNVVGFNDFPKRGRANGRDEVLGLFDAIIESSKVGCRKPDPRFYEIACDTLGITPPEAVFLDDLGVNLKPARELGMRTIKVTEPSLALAELEAVVGFALR
jgi:putative hydrolase of the HAD superfamily